GPAGNGAAGERGGGRSAVAVAGPGAGGDGGVHRAGRPDPLRRSARLGGDPGRDRPGGRLMESRAALNDYLTELRLPTMRRCWAELARQATQETLPYEGYLLELVERESAARRHSRIDRRLRESRLPLEKSLERFELGRLPARV